jgi:hypothetical protein
MLSTEDAYALLDNLAKVLEEMTENDLRKIVATTSQTGRLRMVQCYANRLIEKREIEKRRGEEV